MTVLELCRAQWLLGAARNRWVCSCGQELGTSLLQLSPGKGFCSDFAAHKVILFGLQENVGLQIDIIGDDAVRN